MLPDASALPSPLAGDFTADDVAQSVAPAGDGARRRTWASGLREFLLVGGITPFLFPLSWLLRRRFGLDAPEYAVGFLFFYGAYLVNDPHFAVTYVLFYRDARARALGDVYRPLQRARYLLAGLVVPLGLAVWAGLALATESAVALGFLIQLMFLLVGWHYVKQGFGVFTVLSGRRGVRWSPRERVTVLAHCFAGWAYAWASPADRGTEVEEKGVVYTTLAHSVWLEQLTHVVFLATVIPLVWMLVQKRRRRRAAPHLHAAHRPPLHHLVVDDLHEHRPARPLCDLRRFTRCNTSTSYGSCEGNEAREREGPPWFERSAAVRMGLLAASALGLGCLLFHLAPARSTRRSSRDASGRRRSARPPTSRRCTRS